MTDAPRPSTEIVGPSGSRQASEIRTLKHVGTINLPLVTSMDRDPTSGDILLINYFQMFRFPKTQSDQHWSTQTPKATDLPRLKQIEAVVADRQGTVWVTSEGTPAAWAKVLEKRD
jgi:type II secretory pathway predicted ATPase ExeA